MQEFIDKVIPFIIAQQEASGGFPTWESYPVVNPSAGWTRLPDSSPFITANILFALIQVNDKRLNGVIEKGAQNLLASKEGSGLWRFWPIKSKQHPVPLDMDDTCIALSVLNQLGYKFDVTNILFSNTNASGYFETWFRPRLSTLVNSPMLFYNLLRDYITAWPTYQLKHFDYADAEPAVAANALLYLGENEKTKTCINLIIKQMQGNILPAKFYEDEVVILYHIARAYANGIQSFKVLDKVLADRICNRFQNALDKEPVLMMAMAANVLLDYKMEIKLAERLLATIAERISNSANWPTDAYFCSRDKNFLAGSPALAAAVFAEACAKLNRHKPA